MLLPCLSTTIFDKLQDPSGHSFQARETGELNEMLHWLYQCDQGDFSGTDIDLGI